MRIEMGVPASVETSTLEKALERVAEELKIEVTLRAERPPDL
jgi:glycine cleavage system regulatory protein